MTTTNMIAILIHRGDSLDLVSHAKQAGNYDLSSFSPPTSYYETVYGQASDWGQQRVSEAERNLAWGFGINLYGTNATEVKRAERILQAFLSRAGDESDPLYFAWRPFGDYEFEPTHGTHGKYARYEIVEGYVILPREYHTLLARGQGFVKAEVRLTIKPMSQRRILSGMAAGNILEEIYKTANGQSRGVRLNSARTNYFKNPTFDHPSTWNTGWTAGGDLYEDQNTDPRYCLFGRSSVRLVYDGTAGGGASDCYLSSVTAGSTNAMVISCFVKKIDGEALQSSDFFFVKGTTSIIGMGSGAPLDVGDGWWWAWVTTTGEVGATDFGVRLSTGGRFLFFDGFQIEFGTVPTFLLHGDQVGANWSGTPFESTSVASAASSLKYPRKILFPSYSEGTLRAIWKPDFTARYTSAGANFMLVSDDNLELFYDGTNNRFAFTDGTQSCNSTSTILGNNTIYTLHATFDSTNGLKLYLNGALVGSNATYTLPALADAADYFRVGANSSGLHILGTFYGFATFAREMTAAEVLADYTQAAALLADDMRVDDIPWTWTKNGNGLVYNQNDQNEGNYFITGGITGDVITPEIIATLSDDWATVTQMHFGRMAIDQRDFSQIIPGIQGNATNLLFHDESGVVDANASGGEHKSRTLSTSGVTLGNFASGYTRQNTYFAGMPVRLMGRVKDSGGGASANLQTALVFASGQFATYTGEYRNVPALGTANFSLIDFGQATYPPSVRFRPEGGQIDNIYYIPIIKRSTGSSTFLCDYIALFPYPFSIKAILGFAREVFAIKGGTARTVGLTSASTWAVGQGQIDLADPLSYEGWRLEFAGGKLNIVNLLIGEINGSDTAAITWTVTLNEVWLTVRNQIG